METSIRQTQTHRANTLASCAAHNSCSANGKLPAQSVAYKRKKINVGRFEFLKHQSCHALAGRKAVRKAFGFAGSPNPR